RKMGYHRFDCHHPYKLFCEHAALTKGTSIDIHYLTYDILKEKRAIQWPYTKELNGRVTPRLFTNKKFHTPSQKAIIHSFDDANQSEAVTGIHPLVLTTGRIRDQWHSMSKTGKVNKLMQHISESFLEIHPEDALVRGITDSDL